MDTNTILNYTTKRIHSKRNDTEFERIVAALSPSPVRLRNSQLQEESFRCYKDHIVNLPTPQKVVISQEVDDDIQTQSEHIVSAVSILKEELEFSLLSQYTSGTE